MNIIDIEKSIIKRFRKEIWRPFTKAVTDFNLLENNDKVGICISGGKDSFLLAKCMEEIKKHGKIKFDIEYILMDPGYNKKNMNLILKNAKALNINLHIFKNDIFENIKNTDNACYLCARKRRGALYAKAKELGCNKIALGHHFDDVIETILMSQIYNGEFKTMLPILGSTNFKGMELIRPLYYVREKEIIAWVKYNNLKFIDCACKVTKKKTSKRLVMKEVINYLNNIYKGADVNIMNSTMNVNLNTLLSYKKEVEDN